MERINEIFNQKVILELMNTKRIFKNRGKFSCWGLWVVEEMWFSTDISGEKAENAVSQLLIKSTSNQMETLNKLSIEARLAPFLVLVIRKQLLKT